MSELNKTEITPEIRQAVIDAIADAIGDAYDCMRVWDAWSCGTMGPDDFWPVNESPERLEGIADAAINAIFKATNQEGICDESHHQD